MLVLSCKPQESVFVNDEVVVTVLNIQGDTVRLGIEAPVGMPVYRGEVYARMQNQGSPSPVD
jgi:carbon storage regulator